MRRLLALSAACALLLPGCALLKSIFAEAFQEPTLRFKTAQLADASLGGATVNLVYTVENPNPFGLSLAQVSYAFFVEGKQVVAGTPPKGLDLPASGAAELVFPAAVKFADLGQVVQTFLTKDHAAYRAEGSLGIDTPVGVIQLPLRKEGTFEVPKVPEVSFQAPRVTQLSFTQATVEFPLVVTNRNSFSLPVSGLSGALSVQDARVGTLSTGNLGDLPGRTPKQVTLPLTIRFAEAAGAALALRSGTARLNFSGAIQSGGLSIPLSFGQSVSFAR